MTRAGSGTGWPASAGRPRVDRLAALEAAAADASHEPRPLPAGAGPHTCATCGAPLEPVYGFRHAAADGGQP